MAPCDRTASASRDPRSYQGFPGVQALDHVDFTFMPAKFSPARRERRGQVDSDQGGDRCIPARCRRRPPRGQEIAPRIRPRRGRWGSPPSIRRSICCRTCRWPRTSFSAGSRHGSAWCARLKMRRRATALLAGYGLDIDVAEPLEQLFGRGAADRRNRARRRSVGQGADPRRADREPGSP